MTINHQPSTPLRVYFTPLMLCVLLQGFSSGLPLALTASSLLAWLKDGAVDISTIGLFASVGIPYSIKFLWAPVIDTVPFPLLSRWLGRRRGWIFATQMGLFFAIYFMGNLNPATQTWWVALAALAVAALSASQDVVLDAWRVESLDPKDYGPGTAMFTLGYRMGMLASGAGALYLAEYYGWHACYALMGLLVVVGLCTTLLCREPKAPQAEPEQTPAEKGEDFAAWMKRAVVGPMRDFMLHERWLIILLFIATYKLGDAFLGVMTNPFLIEIGFTKPQIASIVKIYGTIATLIGAFAGGYVAQRFGVLRPLFFCGLLHALTNLVFLLLAQAGPDTQLLAAGVTLDNLAGGMSSAVLVVYISGLCNLKFTATQYALFSAIASVGRTMVASSAGYAVAGLGWEWFFVLTVVLGIPSLVLLWWLRPVQPEAPPKSA